MMDGQRDTGLTASESNGERKPWVAPHVEARNLADAETSANPGDDGSGIFTLS